ncbi:MAG: PQQ-binding-like beta-propeller repeat protein [Candidatus Methanofastidiosia archaeon]|jgi:outer membrane protein assembly factor BamB
MNYETASIVDDTVLIFWKDSAYHTLRSRVVVLDVITGEYIHKIEKPISFSKIFLVDKNVFGTSGTDIYKIDIKSEEITLSAKIPKKGPLMYPLILENKIIIPTMPGGCFSTEFDILWNLEDTIPAAPDLYPNILAGDESMIALLVTENGFPHLIVIDPSTGTVKWVSEKLPAALWMAVGNDVIYCGGKKIWAFKKDGEILWEVTPEERIACNMVVGPEAIYAADIASNLYKVDFHGNVIWKKEWEVSPIYLETHLIGAGDTLYCIGNYGPNPVDVTSSYITAFNMGNGSIVWENDFGSYHIKAPPAVVNGILVFGTVSGAVIAVASDPELFMKQGDLFLSDGYTDKAINSYKKAADIYEQKGNLSQYEEIQQKIEELESPPESSPPETTPPETTSQPSTPFSFFVLIFTGTLSGIFIVYFLVKRKE